MISSQTITSSSPGHIIVIHGISSGGKTSTVNELALQIGASNTEVINWDKYMRSAIDQKALEIGYDLGESKYNWWQDFFKITEHLTEKERKDISLQIRTLFFTNIKESALSGKIVLVDTIDSRDISVFLESMGNIKVTLVLLYTPIDTIVKFIEHRNNCAVDEYNKRSLLISLIQYQNGFKSIENESDPVVDSLDRYTAEYYLNLMNQETYWYRPKPENFEYEFIQHFKLDQMSSVKITPALQYNVIVHGSELSIAERAQIFKDLLRI